MSAFDSNHDFFEALKAEHRELYDLLTETRGAIASPNRSKARLEDLVSRLSDRIEIHFRHEDRGGYLGEVLQRAPRLIAHADVLHEQHEFLQERIEKLRLLVYSGVESPAWWNKVHSDFETFSSGLLAHERAENDLVQQAFSDDIGRVD